MNSPIVLIHGLWLSLPFLILFQGGFGYVALTSFAQWLPRVNVEPPVDAVRQEIGRSAHEHDNPAVGAEETSRRPTIAAVGPCRVHTHKGGRSGCQVADEGVLSSIRVGSHKVARFAQEQDESAVRADPGTLRDAVAAVRS